MSFKLWLENNDMKKGAGIFFTDGIQFLALKKPKGLWTLPGGHMKKGEDEVKTAEREAKEETGSVKGKQIGSIVERDGEWVSFIYQIKKPFKVKISKEHIDYAWISFKDIGNYKFHPKVEAYLPNHIELAKKKLNEQGDLNSFSTGNEPGNNRLQTMKTKLPDVKTKLGKKIEKKFKSRKA